MAADSVLICQRTTKTWLVVPGRPELCTELGDAFPVDLAGASERARRQDRSPSLERSGLGGRL